ncbi:hypothetical protein CSHISOI_08559 [Colletotrichum shisoi]|uniref:Uncharacterized protein n=1 Tax=Colletotrichum shisoi TaxID=2078593 RepID=A0A5Q4BIW2_9PEZI|nr:hypothetical protein CSHISOI_08559 [Colletotrichum shisoi]
MTVDGKKRDGGPEVEGRGGLEEADGDFCSGKRGDEARRIFGQTTTEVLSHWEGAGDGPRITRKCGALELKLELEHLYVVAEKPATVSNVTSGRTDLEMAMAMET